MFLIVFLADLLLKRAAVDDLKEDRDIKAGPLRLRFIRNQGAFMNIGQRAPHLVAALSVIMTAVVGAAYINSGKQKQGLIRLCLSLVLGGALSNTADRLTRGYVVDYIGFPGSRYYYNIGDVGVIAGTALYLFLQRKAAH